MDALRDNKAVCRGAESSSSAARVCIPDDREVHKIPAKLSFLDLKEKVRLLIDLGIFRKNRGNASHSQPRLSRTGSE